MTKQLQRFLALGILVFSLSICSCKEKIQFEPAEIHTFIDAGVAAWHVFPPTGMGSFIKNEEYFVGLNYRLDEKYVLFKKKDTTTWYNSFSIDAKEPLFAEITNFGNLYVHDLTEIYATCPSKFPNSIFCINILDSTRFRSQVDLRDKSLYLQFRINFYEPVFIANKMYISLANWVGIKDLKLKFSKPSIVEIDIKSDSILAPSVVFGKQPQLYTKQYYHQSEGSFLTTDGRYLYQSFTHDHVVYVYDSSSLFKTIELTSKHVDRFTPIDTSGNMSSRDYLIKYITTTFEYTGLVYDSYHQLFYRLLIFPEKATHTRDFVVMVFDKDVNFLSEQLFDGKKYAYSYFVISKEGVYIGRKLELQSPHSYMQLFKPLKIGTVGKLKRFFKGSEVNY